ncbi:MAG: CHAT domain-containing protein [Acidobacteriota bacterium]|nr:CHAT domain-containing protein [Acidobacteriota bacterium]
MTTLRIPGRRDDLGASRKVDRVLGPKIRVEVKEVVQVEDSRAGEEVVLEGVAGDSVVELELEGGVRVWLSVDQMAEDLGEHGVRSAGDGGLVVPGSWPTASRSRGAGAWAVKGLKVLDVDLAGMSARAIAAYLEGQLEPGPGLYHCPDPNHLPAAGRITGPSGVDGSGPILVLVHGTASRTGGSFGGLAEEGRTEVWERIKGRYGDRVYAFEHRTLTESPVQNARELASLLPARAEVHLLSHSRGGLVCELLCQGRRITDGPFFDEDDLRQFDDHGAQAAASRRQLEALGRALKSKSLDVRRFVRVACPARGTTLASGRLDRYLSLGLNAIGWIPPLKASQTYDFVKTLLLAVAKKRVDPAELPGLEAQMPTSPLVRVLNRQDKTVDADLSVIAGDLEGRGLWGRLKTFATDLFYREDHDLVVNTSAMYGGSPRTAGRGRFFFDQGDGVNHFQYFRNATSVEQLEIALGEAGDSAGGFRPLGEAATAREVRGRSFRGGGGEPRPVVFVLPGIMGSHLGVDGDRIWADPSSLAKGGLARLAIDAEGVEADAPIARSYLDLIEFLETAGHEVVPFPYDWRRSVLDEGRRFAEALDAKLGETAGSGMPVRILAHSMGGLVARAAMAQRKSVWTAFRERAESRLVMLGTPTGGTYTIPRLLLARERVLRQLALVDLRHDRLELQRIVAGFGGLLELLPVDGGQDFFDLGLWKRLAQVDAGRWSLPDPTRLRAARRLRQVLEAGPVDPQRMVYVAGQAPATPVAVVIEDGDKVVFQATAEGDGRVPWSSGPPAGIPLFYMPGVKHGALANHAPSFPAIDELLRQGSTDRLPARAPAVRGAGETFAIDEDDADEAVLVYPNRDELEAAALGDDPVSVEVEAEPVLRVRVAYGDLAFAPAPVAVGHYEGDSIVSAEFALDRLLENRLARRHRLGRYPGPIGTSEVVLDSGGRGAIVVGLGRAGELSQGDLATSFAQAVVGYAIKLAEEGRVEAPWEIDLVSLLIGSSEAGIAMEDSIEAIVAGTRAANSRLLADGKSAQPVRIGSLTFLELYEDLAVQALHVLRNAAWPGLAVSRELEPLPAGRRRVFVEPDRSWWLPLEITGDVSPEERARKPEIEQLRFSVQGNRARSETTSLAVNRSLVDGMIEDAMTTLRDDAGVGKILFELLLPNRLKISAPEQRDLKLKVDDQTARFPWELLVDRSGGAQALSLRAGMIRQLATEEFRAEVIRPAAATAVVIGDPPSHLPELRGAQDEARAVIERLESGGFQVANKEHAICPSSARVLETLFTGDYRVVHLAGHGDYDPTDPERTGMVIGEDRFLTPAVINQMRQVPELVFINCCHLGYIDDDLGDRRDRPRAYHRLAANLGAQFIRMGVRAVVAAGWPVSDDAALAFAGTFYERMLAGEEFGKAVLVARQTTHEDHGDSNTWGAYQCYGDPHYRLVGRRPGGDDEDFRFVAPSELVAELHNSVSSARAGSPGWLPYIGWLDEHPRFPPRWREMAAVETAFGRAYAELAEYERAVDHYRRAIELEDGAMTLRDIEQLGNMEVRWGERTGSVRTVQGGLRRLRQVLALGPTTERWSLIGGGYKRLARMRPGKARRGALERMTEAYGKAHELTVATSGAVDPYPLLNYLTGRVLLRRKGDRLADLPSLFEAAVAAAAERFEKNPDFWNAVTPADAALAGHLAAGKLGQKRNRKETVDLYLAARDRAASAREFDSVLDHVGFLIEMRSDRALARGSSGGAEQARADVAALEALLAALEEAR